MMSLFSQAKCFFRSLAFTLHACADTLCRGWQQWADKLEVELVAHYYVGISDSIPYRYGHVVLTSWTYSYYCDLFHLLVGGIKSC